MAKDGGSKAIDDERVRCGTGLGPPPPSRKATPKPGPAVSVADDPERVEEGARVAYATFAGGHNEGLPKMGASSPAAFDLARWEKLPEPAKTTWRAVARAVLAVGRR